MRQPTDTHTVADAPLAVYAATSLDDRDARLLRESNGIVDDVVFPRLRHLGIVEAELHTAAMHYVRLVQWGGDADGSVAVLLGVVRTGVNGTKSCVEAS
jgi:hypothetical protein